MFMRGTNKVLIELQLVSVLGVSEREGERERKLEKMREGWSSQSRPGI